MISGYPGIFLVSSGMFGDLSDPKERSERFLFVTAVKLGVNYALYPFRHIR